MLGKLLKHEFRATGRVMLPLFAVVLFVSFLAHFAVRLLDRPDLPGALTALLVIVVILFGVGLFALGIVSVVLMVNRFRQNILGDEGYLTMTLPVSVHAVIWSKVIVSLVWFILTVVVVGLSGMILAFDVDFLRDLADGIRELFRMFTNHELGEVSVMALELLANLLLLGVTACLSFYAALSIGHGFATHKMLLSVVAYFILSALIGWLTGTLFGAAETALIRVDDEAMTHFASLQGTWHTQMAILAGINLLVGGIHYALTVLNLKYRLNLE